MKINIDSDLLNYEYLKYDSFLNMIFTLTLENIAIQSLRKFGMRINVNLYNLNNINFGKPDLVIVLHKKYKFEGFISIIPNNNTYSFYYFKKGQFLIYDSIEDIILDNINPNEFVNKKTVEILEKRINLLEIENNELKNRKILITDDLIERLILIKSFGLSSIPINEI